MIIKTTELKMLTFIVTKTRFGGATVRRREIMNATQDAVKTLGAWTHEDDAASGSADKKSKGMAKIDWAVTSLQGNGLKHVGRDQWQVG